MIPSANFSLYQQALSSMEFVNAFKEYLSGMKTKEFAKEIVQQLVGVDFLDLMKMEIVSVKDKIYG